MQTAIRAKKRKKELSKEFEGEDFSDFLVRSLIEQRGDHEYEEMESLYDRQLSNPQELYKSFLGYRIGKLEELVKNSYFTIDRVIVYVAKYLLLEEWFMLDEKKGQEKVEALVRGIL